MTLRPFALAAALGFGATACISPYVIRPAQGGPVGISTASSLTMRVDPNAWHGQPWDLEGHFTPLLVDITSQRTQSVWIGYSDFALLDEQGVRYRVVCPYTQRAKMPPAPATRPSVPAPTRATEPPPAAVPHDTIPPDPGHEDNGLDDSWRERFDPDHDLQPIGRGGSSGAILLVDYRRQVRQSEDDGTLSALLHPAYRDYGPYVDSWHESYYPAAPSYDVLRLGLSEGVLSSNERVTGFLYFESATSHADRLELSWIARTPGGGTVALLKVRLLVN
jgi:hypothetical protein